MMQQQAIDYKSMKEELWNAITHGIGFLISIPAYQRVQTNKCLHALVFY